MLDYREKRGCWIIERREGCWIIEVLIMDWIARASQYSEHAMNSVFLSLVC